MIKRFLVFLLTFIMIINIFIGESSIVQAEGENQVLTSASSKLVIPNEVNVRGNITLPTAMDVEGNTVNITWESSNPDVITDHATGENGKIPPGVVKRNATDQNITLTATLEFNGEATQKPFQLTVKKAVQMDDLKGYIYTYFRANLYGNGESQQIHLASSKDGLFWDDMNNNEPILQSTLGTNGVRDSYIVRSPEGDKFHLIATDLDANGGKWSEYAFNGSKSIMVWESDDLINWSNQRMIEIAPENAGNMWAPETIYDPATGEYVVYWASTVNGEGHRIYYAKTRDFWTFTKPEIYKDKTATTTYIDTSMIAYNGTYYRFTKNENELTVLLEKSDSALGNFSLVKNKIADQGGVEGPAIFKFNGIEKWGLLFDGYAGSNSGVGFFPLVAESPEDLAAGNFRRLQDTEFRMPTGAKHGSILPVTQKEYDAVMAKWKKDLVDPVTPDTSDTIVPDLQYKFDETVQGNTVLNTGTSGIQNNGTLYNGANYIEDANKGKVLYLGGGNAGTNSPYLEFPQGYFDGKDNVSIFMDIKSEMDNQFFFTFGVGQNTLKYLFLRTRASEVYSALTVKSNPKEQKITAPLGSPMKNIWTNIAIVLERDADGNHSSMKLYKDGMLLGQNTQLIANLSTLGADLKGYLGKAFYNDPYFKGSFDNVRVYNRALTGEQVTKVFNQTETPPTEIPPTEVPTNLLASYPLIDNVLDVSGNGKHGEAIGNVTYTDGLTLPGGTNSSTNYVKLPDGLFDNQDNVTISSWVKSQTGSGNYSALFFGTPATANKIPVNYWLFNPTNPSGNFKSVFTNSASSSAPWSTEVGVSSTSTTANRGVWTHYTTVISSTSITGYINGVKIGTASKTRLTSDFGTGLNAYIGRSNYLNDAAFAGSFLDLRIYGQALDDNGVASLYADAASQMSLQAAKKNLSLGDTSAVTGNLTLPATVNDAAVSWKSSNESVISNTGAVSLKEEEEQTVTLTATLALSGLQTTKEFTVTLVSRKNMLEAITNKLYIPYVLTQIDKLPASIDGASVSWSSSDTAIIGNDGTIKPLSEGMAEVTLTATISYNGQQAAKVLNVKVLEKSPSYLLGYIRSGSSVVTDALHLGYSEDDVAYTALNNNTGVLFAKADFRDSVLVGVTKKLINPYLFRMQDGTFGVVATRLNNSSTQENAEKSSILFFTSKDLISYEEAGLVSLLTNETVSNPIAEYDAVAQEYRIEWKAADGTSYYNTTKDFKTVSAAKAGAKIKAEKVTTNIANALPAYRMALLKTEAKSIANKFMKVTNTHVLGIEVNIPKGQNFTFDDLGSKKAIASYSDGSTAEKVVNWNLDEFNRIDLSKEGVYAVSGTVKQTSYPSQMIKSYADPDVLLYNGNYYFIATNESGQKNLNIRKADTILGLKDAASTTIWSANASGDMSGSIWAPELHAIKGDLYIFFAAGSPSLWNTVQSRVMKLKNGGDPLSPSDWEAPIRVLNKDGGNLATVGVALTLDMTYFEHRNEHYVVWSHATIASPNGISEIYIAKINPDQPWKLITDPVRIARPEYGWDRQTTNVDEGPFIVKHGNKLFLAFSGSGIDVTYVLGLLKADEDSDLLNPASWTKTGYPILTSESVPGESGPGHNSFTVDEDGNVVNIYHARPVSGAGNRNTFARRVHWAADGTPVLDMIDSREILPENRTVTALIKVTAGETNVPVQGVTLNKSASSLMIGESDTLVATVTPSDATNKHVTFTSNHAAVSVSSAVYNEQTGTTSVTITGVSEGNAIVTASTENGGLTAQFNVTVEKPLSGVTSTLTGGSSVSSEESFDITYGLSNVTQSILAQDMTFNYDSSKLQFVSVESLKPGLSVFNQEETAGQVRIIAASTGPENAVTSAGELLKLHFKAKAVTQSTTGSIHMSNVVVADTAGVETAVNSGTAYSIEIIFNDKTALNAAIANAQALHDAAAEGSGKGQYPTGSKETLQAAIDSAKAIADHNTVTQQQINQAVNQLAATVQIFTASVNVAVKGDLNGDDKISIGDLAIMAVHYGFTSADPSWNLYKKADLNDDGIIDIVDLASMGQLIVQ